MTPPPPGSHPDWGRRGVWGSRCGEAQVLYARAASHPRTWGPRRNRTTEGHGLPTAPLTPGPVTRRPSAPPRPTLARTPGDGPGVSGDIERLPPPVLHVVEGPLHVSPDVGQGPPGRGAEPVGPPGVHPKAVAGPAGVSCPSSCPRLTDTGVVRRDVGVTVGALRQTQEARLSVEARPVTTRRVLGDVGLLTAAGVTVVDRVTTSLGGSRRGPSTHPPVGPSTGASARV